MILCALFVLMLSFCLLQKRGILHYLTNENEQTFILKIHKILGFPSVVFRQLASTVLLNNNRQTAL